MHTEFDIYVHISITGRYQFSMVSSSVVCMVLNSNTGTNIKVAINI